jgi:hypothetical protein
LRKKCEKGFEDVPVSLIFVLYHTFTMAFKSFFQFGKEVEERCLKMFIRGLTSDMNAQEASKKTKQLKGGTYTLLLN